MCKVNKLRKDKRFNRVRQVPAIKTFEELEIGLKLVELLIVN